MKLRKVLICSAALVLLTGCSLFGGQKVSAAKFQEKVDALEEHQYSKAVVSYSIDMKGTGLYEDSTEKASGKIEYTYDADSKSWTTDSSDKHAGEYKYSLYSIRGMKIDTDEKEDDDSSYKTTTTYYVNPLGAKSTIKGESTTLGVTVKMNNSYSYTFDKYGFVTKSTSKVDQSTEGGSSGITVSGTVKGTEKVTISYK